MSLYNCEDCPSSCLGNDVLSDCVVHNGQSLRTYLEEQTATTTSEPQAASGITSDDVMSKSIVRNTSSICSSQIIERQFTYSLSANQNSTTFGWSLVGFIGALPSGYNSQTIRVRISGSTVNGKNVIADSSKASAGLNVRADQFPITVDVMVRVTSPCGDIDMERSLKLVSPATTGTLSATLNATDLNPQSGEIGLTDQLNNLENNVYTIGAKVESLPDDMAATIETLQEEISNLRSEIETLKG